MNQGFFSLLEDQVRVKESLICVGLDPHSSDVKLFREKNGIAPSVSDASVAFQMCQTLVDATKEIACSYKPNAAFFEAFGADGVQKLKDLMDYIPKDIPVILDVKRGDISTTADAYASASYDYFGAHCVTLSPYMGSDSIDPFVGKNPSRGAFVLCKTSNPSSDEFETLKLADGTLLYEKIAAQCAQWNLKGNNVGLVVGATDTEALYRARRAAPDLWILAPGVGFQGGNLEEAAAAGLRKDGLGLLVPISRGISRADDPRAAAESFRVQINNVRAQALAKAKAQENTAVALADYQTGFFNLAIECGVLKFGSFTLKSGRISPYFFNAGLFNTGKAVARLGEYYADTIVKSGIEFDVLFGPAYKGIPLATAIAVSLYTKYNKDVPVTYNRKEAKDHGEGGVLVGAAVSGKRALIVDDVITAGTAIRESLDILKHANCTAVGVVIALDRQERANDTTQLSAIQGVKQEFGIDVVSIVCLSDLLSFLQEGTIDAAMMEQVRAYKVKYGVQY